jgi:hypothetical protein
MAKPSTFSFDRDRWLRALEEIAIALGKEGDAVELCLIGSAACILGGMHERSSIDLDVWMPDSNFDELELKEAVLKAGLLYDPKTHDHTLKPYIQIVEPGIVQVGKFQSILMKRMGRLRITRPPYENIIASKLGRASLKDIQDIQYLIQNFRPDKKIIAALIDTFPISTRDMAKENLIYLEIFQ